MSEAGKFKASLHYMNSRPVWTKWSDYLRRQKLKSPVKEKRNFKI